MPRGRRKNLFAGLLISAVVGCGGCGGESGSPFQTTPAPPGSREPELNGDAGGLVLSWVEGGSAKPSLRYARLAGRRWSETHTITSDEHLRSNWAHLPAVTTISESAMAAVWPSGTQGAERSIDVAFSFSPDGVSWSEPVHADPGRKDAQRGWAALVSEGASRFGMVSLDSRSGATRLLYRIGSAAGFEEPRELDAQVCPWCRPSAVRVGDDILVAYRGHTDDQLRDVRVVRRRGGQWQEPQPVHDDGWRIAGCPVNGPALVAHERNVALAWFTAAGSEPRVLVSRAAGDSEFGEPLRLDSGDPLGRVDAEMLADGTVYVSWLEKTEAGAEVCVRPVLANGTAGPTRVMGNTAAGPESGFPRMAFADGRIYVAWVEPSFALVRLASFRP